MSFFGKFYFSSSLPMGADADATKELLRMKGGPGAHHDDAWIPPTDVIEIDNGYVILMEIPGVPAEGISMQLCDEVLTVCGHRSEVCIHSKKRYRQMELHHGAFERQVILPGPLAPHEIQANLNDGILEILVPRGEQPHSGTVEIHFSYQQA